MSQRQHEFRDHARSELDRCKREINLTEFAASYGFRRIPLKSSRASVAMAHPSGDKIIVTKGPSGHWIYCSVADDRDRGTIIDFVLTRSSGSSSDFAAVLAELRPWIGDHRPSVPAAHYQPIVAAVVRDPQAVQREFNISRLAPTSAYLNARGIRSETLEHPRFRATWRLDARGTVLFPHRDLQGEISGCEKKHHHYTGFTTGGAKGAWLSNCQVSDRTLVITESAIDALSFYQIHQLAGARYLSTAGTLSAVQSDLLRRAVVRMPPGSTIVAATDNDKSGDKLAAALSDLTREAGLMFHRPLPPLGKDWNDTLQQLEAAYIRSLSPPTLIR